MLKINFTSFTLLHVFIFIVGGFLAPPQYDADIQPVPTSDRPAPRL